MRTVRRAACFSSSAITAFPCPCCHLPPPAFWLLEKIALRFGTRLSDGKAEQGLETIGGGRGVTFIIVVAEDEGGGETGLVGAQSLGPAPQVGRAVGL